MSSEAGRGSLTKLHKVVRPREERLLTVIGSTRRKFWDENGFLVLPGFFDESEVDAVRAVYDRTWEQLPPDVVVDDLVTGRRCYIADLDEEERRHNFKVNDLFLADETIRRVILSERVGMVLEELLGDEPAVCNTLNFDKGSQQADHLDTLYMTPESETGLVATWMALEDTLAAAGPLRYYPGSNHIKPYRFSTGSMHTVHDEMPQWSDYMASEVERMGLEEERFLARRGDLFIWHALLLHGGSAIDDIRLTRQSLVTHYWRQTDCEIRGHDLRPAPGGWWIKRPPLAVPVATPATGGTPDEARPETDDVVDFPAEISSNRAAMELRDRMDALETAID
jgi:ectoine hydroxylase-related dioxygenase (phytanoyl-CoA dioxygenase family)